MYESFVVAADEGLRLNAYTAAPGSQSQDELDAPAV